MNPFADRLLNIVFVAAFAILSILHLKDGNYLPGIIFAVLSASSHYLFKTEKY